MSQLITNVSNLYTANQGLLLIKEKTIVKTKPYK